MRPRDAENAPSEEACWKMVEEGVYIDANATLEAAMPMFDKSAVVFLPVLAIRGEGQAPDLRGALFHMDALKAYNKALAATAKEEHS